MAADPFNILTGLTVGIPPVSVIDANGNLVSNVFTSGNVFSNAVYSNNYFYANGHPLEALVAGSNTQVQYNDDNQLGASPAFTFDSTSNLLSVTNLEVPGETILGDASTVTILGGINGYFLQTDGLGNLTWSAAGGGGNGSPGGSNTQIQYNDNGEFGGKAGFTFDENTDTLSVPNISSNIINASNGITAGTFYGNASGLFSIPSANISGTVAVANTVSNAAQPNITSVGTLTSLLVSGGITSNAIITGSAIVTSGTMQVSVGGNLVVSGNANFSNSSLVNLGSVANIKISGGTNGYVLSTDGLGNLSWIAGGGGGNGVPGGANTQVQFNNAGSFGGSPYFTYNTNTNTLNVAGDFIANTLTLGSGAYKFNKSNVFFATSSSMANVALVSVPATDISSVDFTIIATDNTASRRQVSKISAVLYNASLNYNEYSTLYVGGLSGNFTMAYNPGNILVAPSAVLYVEPTTTNLTTYKIMITVYEP